MATFNKVTFANASPKGGGDNRLNSIPAKAKHVNDLINSLETGDNTFSGNNTFSGVTNSLGLCHMGYVDNTTAFVQNDNSNVIWVQPGGTIIKNIYLFVVLQPTLTVHATTDLGFLVGTAAEGEQLVAHQTDTLIDAAANTTALKTGAFVHVATRDIGDLGISGPTVRLLPVPEDTDLTVLIADQNYAAADRNIFFGTSATNQVVGAPGTVRWLIEYMQVS